MQRFFQMIDIMKMKQGVTMLPSLLRCSSDRGWPGFRRRETSEDLQSRPYGFDWALKGHQSGNKNVVIEDGKAVNIREAHRWLWYWGFAFWDKGRLEDWDIDSMRYIGSRHEGVVNLRGGQNLLGSGEIPMRYHQINPYRWMRHSYSYKVSPSRLT